MSVKHLYLIAVAAIFGCAPAGGTSGTFTAPRRSNMLTDEEIVAARADITNVYDALARLRPNWLAPHGAMSSNPQASEFAHVFVDGQLYGDIESLRNLQAYHVAEVRYYNVTEAGAKFGIQAGNGGAIEITTKVR